MKHEETLDPQDWSELRGAGHALVDEVVDWLSRVRERPPWQPLPGEVRARLSGPVPRAGQGLEATLDETRRDVLPYPYGNVHPRFWGWVNGSGVPIAILADFLASAMNSNTGAFDHAAVAVEEQVMDWLREMLAFPAGTGGLLTSGCSMANLIALGAARSARASFDVRRQGLAAAPRPLTLYGSIETHSSVQKAVEILGFGGDALRRIPVDGDYRIDVAALERTIAADREAGLEPICVVGNAGTVNTGAIDDLQALADVCEREGLWLHVDGAFGALAWLCPEERPALAGLQRADSLAFDLHKWMYLPSDVGGVLVRDPEALQRAYALSPAYLQNTRGGLAARAEGSFKDMGLELTRRFRALKVWMSLKEHGLDKFERMIRQNVSQAQHLVQRIEASGELELLAPAPLNVVSFRYFDPGVPFEVLEHLNRELLVRLQENGAAVPSNTVLGGVYALRVAITNHRTERSDIDFLADEVVRLGAALVREWRDDGGMAAWIPGRTPAATPCVTP